MAPPGVGDHIRYGAAPDIQTGRDTPVGQVTDKFQAQQFFYFTHPHPQSCHGYTPQEDALSDESVVHCFQIEKRGILETGSRIPTDDQIWPEQIEIRGRIKSESAIGLHWNEWSVWVGIGNY